MTKFLNNLKNFGWLYIYAQFFPVYFTQDFNYQNNGYDILTLKPTDRSYNRSKW